MFIPAGRSLFSIFQRNIWSILTHELSIDPFLIEFGRLYQRTRQLANKRSDSPHSAQIDEIASRLLCGKYERDGVRDFIRAKDGRRTTLEHSSSGQQEALPLAVLLTRMAHDSTTWENSTVFVEEPEAHLYPSAQRDIVHLLATAHDLSSPDSLGQYVITTHSPYILTALNNLVYAGKIKRDFPDKAEAVNAVMDNAVTIDPSGVRAYMFADGGVESIIDEESQLVVAEALDGVSGALANEFQSLMDIEFGDSEE
ncbi:MAG TPA: AAA family ATPase [Capsulimonadaceae bacterium]